jgi:hypothetical protein
VWPALTLAIVRAACRRRVRSTRTIRIDLGQGFLRGGVSAGVTIDDRLGCGARRAARCRSPLTCSQLSRNSGKRPPDPEIDSLPRFAQHVVRLGVGVRPLRVFCDRCSILGPWFTSGRRTPRYPIPPARRCRQRRQRRAGGDTARRRSATGRRTARLETRNDRERPSEDACKGSRSRNGLQDRIHPQKPCIRPFTGQPLTSSSHEHPISWLFLAQVTPGNPTYRASSGVCPS